MLTKLVLGFKRFAFRRGKGPGHSLAPPADLTLEELLDQLAQRGLVAHTDGHRLLFSSPRPTLDDQLVRQLQRHRPALLRILPRDGAGANRRQGRVVGPSDPESLLSLAVRKAMSA